MCSAYSSGLQCWCGNCGGSAVACWSNFAVRVRAETVFVCCSICAEHVWNVVMAVDAAVVVAVDAERLFAVDRRFAGLASP